MLVLSRKAQEQIRAGEFIFTVLSIVGNRVKVGIEGPQGAAIDREEIHQRRLTQTAGSNTNHDGH